jgi:hypothetical protein
MSQHVALKVYEQYLAGDHITDEDLNLALEFFKQLAYSLSVMGSVFHLAFCEANRTYLDLYRFQQARK